MSKIPVVEIADEHAAHSIFNSILTQVAVTKKSYKTKFKISYADLMKGVGEEDFDSFTEVNLQVEISCKWVAAELEDEEVIIEQTGDDGDTYE